MNAKPWFFKLALTATALACIVVVLGAFTRLNHAGLGCPDWPGCYGHLTWPTTDVHVAAAEKLFPESPVEHDKTWPEMVHRHFAGILGLFILALTLFAWRPKAQALMKQTRGHTLGLLVLVIIQAAFGMWTVTLKLWPQVVTAHLLGGFTTLSLLWLLVQRYGSFGWTFSLAKQEKLTSLKMFAIMVLILVVGQIALGGWTSSNYAALACTDFPTCQGQWWPRTQFSQAFNFAQTIGPNYLGGLLEGEARTAIHMAHRVGALLITLVVSILAYRLWRIGAAGPRNIACTLVLVLVCQIGLGISNILASLPLPVAVAHNAVGALLLLTLVTLVHRLFTLREHP